VIKLLIDRSVGVGFAREEVVPGVVDHNFDKFRSAVAVVGDLVESRDVGVVNAKHKEMFQVLLVTELHTTSKRGETSSALDRERDRR